MIKPCVTTISLRVSELVSFLLQNRKASKHFDAHLYVKTVKMVGHWLVAVGSFVESDLKHFLFHFYYITQMLYVLNERSKRLASSDDIALQRGPR